MCLRLLQRRRCCLLMGHNGHWLSWLCRCLYGSLRVLLLHLHQLPLLPWHGLLCTRLKLRRWQITMLSSAWQVRSTAAWLMRRGASRALHVAVLWRCGGCIRLWPELWRAWLRSSGKALLLHCRRCAVQLEPKSAWRQARAAPGWPRR